MKRASEDAAAPAASKRQNGAGAGAPVAATPPAAGAGAGAGTGAAAAPTSGLYTREQFLKDFEALTAVLCDEILPSFEMGTEPREWIRAMTKYNVPGGKLNRGLTVVHTMQKIRGDKITADELHKASVLGWCVEWLQACFLVADDIMDESITRRGQPCWYRQDKVQMVAINDAFILRSSLLMFAKREFGKEPFYAQLLDLLNETTFQTELGQLLDLTSAPLGGQVDLSRFTKERHRLIVKYKTSFYSFYLPVAMAMMLSGVSDEAEYTAAKDILTEMGVYFQVQDDYLDCYADEATLGKIGTDIQDNKCSWLVVQALDAATPEQRKLLNDHYGRNVPESIQKVKDLYAELKLADKYHAYEAATYKSLCDSIAALKGATPPAVFMELLAKIYGRDK